MSHAALKLTDRLTADERDSAARIRGSGALLHSGGAPVGARSFSGASFDPARHGRSATTRGTWRVYATGRVQAHRSAWRTDRKHRFWNTCMPYPYPTVLQHCHALALLHGTGDHRAMAGGLRPAEFREHGANGK